MAAARADGSIRPATTMVRAFLACCLCLSAIPRAAAAEWQITPMVGVTFNGNTSLADVEHATDDPHKGIGGAVTFLTSGLVGAEAVVSLTPGFFQTKRRGGDLGPALPGSQHLVTGSSTYAVMGNALLTVPQRLTEYSLRPFVSGGLGLLRASQESLVLNFDESMFGFNVGGGAIGFFTPRTGVRFDFRYYANVHRQPPEGSAVAPRHLRYMVASIGLVFRTSAPPVR